ncbi:flagellar hook-length control protein FliK [Parahaliea mediterranea]|uniref:flagellar hook-length control protein FliK n=1 Tax=Parahaliea mediterranea TaxID=651086 RepID=UPI000E2F8E66|nr:flagellar hook-length control protein FliK [Parahaliea mediterranea]
MSGLTPLLDTLLHQVLGKRVDLPQPRDLNEPVKPLQAGIAPQAVHSDSRLDPRALLPQNALAGDAGHSTARAQADTPATGGAGSLQLSAAAREIAGLLARYPAPPGVLRGAPLQPAPGEVLEPPALARAVQGQIAHSGLFYESHLALWYRGRLSADQLALEPQMSARPQPAPPAVGAAPTHADDAPERPLPEGSPARLSEAQPARLPETLAGVVRHQLEMLATPVVRWEGDVWDGLFLALAIFAPEVAWDEGRQPGRQGAGDESGKHDDKSDDKHDDSSDAGEDTWRTELELDLAQRGRLQVRMTLQAQALTLELAAATALSEQLERRSQGLEQRLHDCGFQPVNLAFRALDDD